MKIRSLVLRTLAVCCWVVVSVPDASSQELNISAEIRPRYELRNGYMQLIQEDVDPASFVSQRSRLNLRYHRSDMELYMSVQNVHVWGDTPTLSASENHGVMMHEAWGQFNIVPGFAIRAGRQEIALDNERIFGAVNWAQQGRSHDAIMGIFEAGDDGVVKFGYALSAAGQTVVRPIGGMASDYKNMKFVHFETEFSSGGSLGLLFFDQAMTPDGTKEAMAHNQTSGIRLVLGDRVRADLSYYHQSGKLSHLHLFTGNPVKNDLSANYAGVKIDYRSESFFQIGVGAEYLSGTGKEQLEDDQLGNFVPWFGTNHKFNGFMDHFYVSNQGYSDGLLDLYGTVGYDNERFSIYLAPHFFRAAVSEDERLRPTDDGYGWELDFRIGYHILDDVELIAGYSQLFSHEGLQERIPYDFSMEKPTYKDGQNWAWIMLAFKPNLFKHRFAEEK